MPSTGGWGGGRPWQQGPGPAVPLPTAILSPSLCPHGENDKVRGAGAREAESWLARLQTRCLRLGWPPRPPLEGTQHRPHFPREQILLAHGLCPGHSPARWDRGEGGGKGNGRGEVSAASGGGWGLASVISAAQPLGQPAMEGWTMDKWTVGGWRRRMDDGWRGQVVGGWRGIVDDGR